MSNTTKTTSLTADEIIERILKAKGNFVKAVWKSNPTPAAAHKKAGIILEKHTDTVCRAGINFSNLSSVQAGIESNERGEVQELPFGTWHKFPYIIKHTPKGSDEEQYYIRLYPTENRSNTIYFVNGEQVDKDNFSQYLTESERKKMYSGEKPECFTIKMDNILATEDFGG